MTDLAKLAAGLSEIQREALRRAKSFGGPISLTDYREDSWDITEGLSEKIADPVCGKLTRLGCRLRAHLLKDQTP